MNGVVTAPKNRFGGRLRRTTTNVGLLGGSLGIAVLAAELLVRLVAPQQLILKRPDLWQPADTLGWIHQPNLNTTVNTGERTVQFRTDFGGNRVGRAGRRQGSPTLLLLGDSFMEALQVEYEESLAGLLEGRLPALLKGSLAVRNAAVGGWEPDQYLLHARRAITQEVFDLVLVSLFMENDVTTVRRERVPPRPPTVVHGLRSPRRLTWSEFVDAVFYPINDFLEVRSHLFTAVKTRLQTPLMRLRLTEAQFASVYLRSERESERWTITLEICRQIAEVARTHGVPTLFVLIPASYQVDTTIFRQYAEGFGLDPQQIDLDQPNRIMGERLHGTGIPVIDALPALRRAFAEGARPYGYVDRHFSAEGHEIIADLIQERVAALLKTGRQAGARRSYK